MCGIAGILVIHPPGLARPAHPLEVIPERSLDVLDVSMAHRGPDGGGRFRDRATRADGTVVDVAMVHRRLSIIDHAGGAQPMVHDGERLRPDLVYQAGEGPRVASEVERVRPLTALVFNGCIYNHRQLRAELESLGHAMETDHADTEVLLAGYRAWGAGVCGRVIDASMYAAGWWDRERAGLLLMRDFFGQKPLYMSTDHDESPTRVVFSSDAGGVALAGTGLRPLGESVASWITYGHAMGGGPTAGMRSVDPGQLVMMFDPETADDSERAAIRAMTPLPKAPFRSKSRSFMLASDRGWRRARIRDVDALLCARVGERLDADVPLACLLSGGVDSSLISAYAQEIAGPITTISVRMPDVRYDESHHARHVAEHLGTRHVVVDAQPAAAEDLKLLIETSGLPFGDSSLLPTYWACRAASEHAGVLLTGDGGDELFVGYERHLTAPHLNALSVVLALPTWAAPARWWPARDPTTPLAKGARLLEAARRASYPALLAVFPPGEARALLGKGAPRAPWLRSAQTPHEQAHGDLSYMLPSDYLRKVDLASKAAAVETRAPFLDRRVLSACATLGAELHHGGRKALLRDVARKRLPVSIVDRPKQGFAIPVGEWFRTDFGGMRTLLRDHLESSDPFPGLVEAGLEIDLAHVARMLREHDEAGEASRNPWHGRDHSQRLYVLLVLSIWCRWLEGMRAEKRPGVSPGPR